MIKKVIPLKLPDKTKQDEKTESTENSHGWHVQSDVLFVMLQTAVVVVQNENDSKELKIKPLFNKQITVIIYS